MKTETENSVDVRIFGLSFTSHYILESNYFSREASCISFSHIRSSHWNQTPDTVILDQICSQKHMTGPNRPPFKRWISLTKPTAASYFMSWSRATSGIDEHTKGALIAQVTKIFANEFSKDKYVDGCIFLMDPTRISEEIQFYHSYKNLQFIWREAGHPFPMLRVGVHALESVWISSKKNPHNHTF